MSYVEVFAEQVSMPKTEWHGVGLRVTLDGLYPGMQSVTSQIVLDRTQLELLRGMAIDLEKLTDPGALNRATIKSKKAERFVDYLAQTIAMQISTIVSEKMNVTTRDAE